jgi:hypothetical protein
MPSIFSPMPANLTAFGFGHDGPGRAAARVAVQLGQKNTPSMDMASLKETAAFTASWPVMASTTSRVSLGADGSFHARSSSISVSSICRRPAVSRITTLIACCFAWVTAARANFRRVVMFQAENGDSSCRPNVSSCAMAAGRVNIAGSEQGRLPFFLFFR